MTATSDVIVVGAGVQGASLAFHLAKRGVTVTILEREAVATGATGRSSGFVRMHYDLESDARLAWQSFPYFEHWSELVGSGDCGFVRTGFLHAMPPELAGALRANVDTIRAIGVDTRVAEPDEIARLIPGVVTDGIAAAAWEPRSGYADPSGTAAGFLEAARRLGAGYIQGCRVEAVLVERDRVAGVDTDRGRFSAPVVVDVAGAWAAGLAATVGVDIPVRPWRHDTAFFGLPPGRTADLPILIDETHGVYFRPEGRELLLVGLEAANEVGGSPDRAFRATPPAILEDMIERLCRRLPWMREGTFRVAHAGQDGITADQRPILGRAGPDGFVLACGFSGTGFKTAPAIGQCLAELILDGAATTVDISGYGVDRFAAGRRLRGPHPYGDIWR